MFIATLLDATFMIALIVIIVQVMKHMIIVCVLVTGFENWVNMGGNIDMGFVIFVIK